MSFRSVFELWHLYVENPSTKKYFSVFLQIILHSFWNYQSFLFDFVSVSSLLKERFNLWALTFTFLCFMKLELFGWGSNFWASSKHSSKLHSDLFDCALFIFFSFLSSSVNCERKFSRTIWMIKVCQQVSAHSTVISNCFEILLVCSEKKF